MKNKLRFIKLCTFVPLGILVLIFNEFCLHHVGYVVGAFMILYALEDIVASFKHGALKEHTKLFTATVEIILAFILIFYNGEPGDTGYIVKLVIWAVWSILIEGEEITECILRFKEKKPAFLNLAESLLSVGFAIAMLLEPTEHHAHTHVYLLGIELICSGSFYYLYTFLDNFIENKFKNNKEEESNLTD